MKLALVLLFAAFTAVAAPAPAPVTVGAYVNDIQNLDAKTHSYSVDVYFWFRWKASDLDPAKSLEFVNPYELWGHTRTLDFEKPQKLPDGDWYQVLHNQGRFSRKFALYDYPFDKQELVVEFEDRHLEALELSYAVAPEGVTVNPELHLPGFKLQPAKLLVEPRSYPTNFGDPRTGAHDTFSRVKLVLPIVRPHMPYAAKLLVPILCVILCTALMLLFHPELVDARVGIGITALLTIVALQLTLDADLPEVDYLVLMDKIYLASYLFVLLAIGFVVRATVLTRRGDVEGARRLDRWSLASLSAVYVTTVAIIVIPRLVG